MNVPQHFSQVLSTRNNAWYQPHIALCALRHALCDLLVNPFAPYTLHFTGLALNT